MPVSGARIVPPRIAAMPTSGQKPGPSIGEDVRFEAAERAAHHQQRRQHAAGGAGPERDRPDGRLHQQDAEDERSRRRRREQLADHVVADAERLREDQAADADDQPADRRPPHPVDRQAVEGVLGGVDRRGQRARTSPPASSPATTHSEQPHGPMNAGVRRDREERARARADIGAASRPWRWPAPPGPGCAASTRRAAARPPAARRPPAWRRWPTCRPPRRRPAASCARRWSGGRTAR